MKFNTHSRKRIFCGDSDFTNNIIFFECLPGSADVRTTRSNYVVSVQELNGEQGPRGVR